jgi:hypothetical protein
VVRDEVEGFTKERIIHGTKNPGMKKLKKVC